MLATCRPKSPRCGCARSSALRSRIGPTSWVVTAMIFLSLAIEQDVGAHHATSVTESLPPANSWMTAILWPGVQVKYSGRSAGR